MDIGALVHAFFDYAGPGGVFVLLVYGAALMVYYLLIRWIIGGKRGQETPATDEPMTSTDA